MIDNSEIQKILEKLENLDDEQLAVDCLKEFNLASKELGRLVLNLDSSLTHDEWKNLCDEAQDRLNAIVHKINNL